ncbi:hypothetical protein JB92DRAFT_3312103 [Gautieria morchelliformis]|nr:hypothetical protein JB92DRAFT_3312103 [Gautieria morchelliformis]
MPTHRASVWDSLASMPLHIDGRSTSSLRPIGIVFESLDHVKGSASFAFDRLKLLHLFLGRSRFA